MTATTDRLAKTAAEFERVEKLERIADTLAEREGPIADELREVAQDIIEHVEPVRIATTAKLLKISKMTVTAWLKRGIFTKADARSKVIVLDPHRLHDVLHILGELRRAGVKPGNWAEQLWYRLQDRELAESGFVVDGLTAYKAGRVQKA